MTMLNKLRLRLHLEREIEENISRGMNPEEARYAAIRSFGGVERVKEESRDTRGIRLLEEVWQDLHYGARMLLKRPGFAIVAVFTLVLGIGANSAIFSVVNGVLLRPLPLEDPSRLIKIWETFLPGGHGTASVPNLKDWREQNTVFNGIAAYQFSSFSLRGQDSPERLQGATVSPNFFEVVGVRPRLGRAFQTGEDEAGRNRVALLSHRLWQRNFGADAGVVGKEISLNGENYTVIGVMPPEYRFPSRSTELWVPLVIPPD